MDTIIIKLYTNAKLSEYNDICIDCFEELLKEMKRFASEHGKFLYFSASSSEDFPINNDCYAEIAYTGELNSDEKKYYIDALQKLASDAEISCGEMDTFDTLRMIRFMKVSDEIVHL